MTNDLLSPPSREAALGHVPEQGLGRIPRVELLQEGHSLHGVRRGESGVEPEAVRHLRRHQGRLDVQLLDQVLGKTLDAVDGLLHGEPDADGSQDQQEAEDDGCATQEGDPGLRSSGDRSFEFVVHASLPFFVPSARWSSA
jgi:hypothetical protein